MAQDPGVPDTLRFVTDGLTVGQSKPISVHVANDFAVNDIDVALGLVTLDGGFAQFDSAVFMGRMADPTVLTLRIVNDLWLTGSSPDTMLLAFLKNVGNELPAGSDVIAKLYFTGLSAGTMSIDTVTVSSGVQLDFIVGGTQGAKYKPVFHSPNVTIAPASNLPVILSETSNTIGTVGNDIGFTVSATSPGGDIPDVWLSAMTGYDDTTITPAVPPVFSGMGEVDFVWTPVAADIGIWRATFTACDSVLNCVTTDVLIQVVAGEQFILGFTADSVLDASQSRDLMHGDYDGDGYPEVLSGGNPSGFEHMITVYDFETPGGWQEAFTLTGLPTYASRGSEQAYLDGDDNLDIVTQWFRSIVTLAGTGDNEFELAREFEVGALPSRAATLIDFNQDQYIDYVFLSGSSIFVLEGRSGGSFVSGTAFGIGSVGTCVISSDFNGDGLDDLALGTANGLSILLADGYGHYLASYAYTQIYGSLDIDVTNQGSDFNDDGVFDLCLATPSVGGTGSQIVVYLGNGDGSFVQSPVRTVSGHVLSNCAGDINNDGYLDIAFVNGSHRYVGVLYGDGTGAFLNETRYFLSVLPLIQIDCVDLDLDGDLDLAVSAYATHIASTMYALLNQLDPPGFSARSVEVQASDNADLELTSSTGRKVNKVACTMSSGAYFTRDLNSNEYIDDMVRIGTVESGSYSLRVAPKPHLPAGHPFSVEYSVNGKPYRLARNAAMSAEGYNFRIAPGGTSDVVPISGIFMHNPRPLFMWPDEGEVIFELSSEIEFRTLVESATVSGGAYTLTTLLEPADTATYYWRTRPTGATEYDGLYAFNLVPGATVAGDLDYSGGTDVGDLTLLISYLFISGPAPDPVSMADFDNTGMVDIGDLTRLIEYLFFWGSLD